MNDSVFKVWVTPVSRPIVLVANSSWYLLHYRRLLLEALQSEGNHVVALSPVDSTVPALSKLLIHIPGGFIGVQTATFYFSVFLFCVNCFLCVRSSHAYCILTL